MTTNDEPGTAVPHQRRWLTIALRIMVVVTFILGIKELIDWFNFAFVWRDTTPSLADVRDYHDRISLFRPAFVLTSLLWLWKTRTEPSRAISRFLACMFTALAVFLLLMSPTLGTGTARKPFFIRLWDCPAGMNGYYLKLQDPRCTERPIDGMTWYIVEEGFSWEATGLSPSSQEDNTAIWTKLPEGTYNMMIATNADLSAYDAVTFVYVHGDSGGVSGSMVTSQRGVASPVKMTASLDGYDIYLIPLPAEEAGGERPPNDSAVQAASRTHRRCCVETPRRGPARSSATGTQPGRRHGSRARSPVPGR